MKFALVLALAPDRQSGRVLGDLVTADDAVKAVKAAITTGRAPDARFPQLVAVGINDVLRQHRFNVTAEQVAEDRERFEVARGDALKRIAELEAQLAEATKAKAEPEADMQPKEGDEPAKEGGETAKPSKKK